MHLEQIIGGGGDGGGLPAGGAERMKPEECHVILSINSPIIPTDWMCYFGSDEAELSQPDGEFF